MRVRVRVRIMRAFNRQLLIIGYFIILSIIDNYIIIYLLLIIILLLTTIDNSHNLRTVRDTYGHINKAIDYSIVLGYIETDVYDTTE